MQASPYFKQQIRLTPMERIVVRSRTYLSLAHLPAAALFARRAGDLETADRAGTDLNQLLSEQLSYVLASIVCSTCFLETQINEFFDDAADDQHGIAGGLDERVRRGLSSVWDAGARRLSFITKYQVALAMAGKEPFPAGASPYQDADLLRDLRNFLVHYIPETIVAFSTIEDLEVTFPTLEKRLASKFPQNRLAPGLSFPQRLMGHGCAAWAVASSLDFSDEFFRRLDLPRPYEHIIGTLSTR